jgi:hypothetical protein
MDGCKAVLRIVCSNQKVEVRLAKTMGGRVREWFGCRVSFELRSYIMSSVKNISCNK